MISRARWRSSSRARPAASIAVHGPRPLPRRARASLTGQPAFLTAVVREPGSVLRVSVERLRELVAERPRARRPHPARLLLRRSILVGLGAGLRIVGSRYSPDTRRLREFAARNRLPHRWIDLEEDPDAERLLRRLGVGPDGDAGRHPGRPQRPAQPDQRRSWRARWGCSDSAAARHQLRPGRRRRRARGAGRLGLRRVGGPEHDRAGRRRDRRAGRHVVADRELPRLPVGDLGRRARRARRDPGPEVRRALIVPGRGDGARATATATTCLRLEQRRRIQAQDRRHRDRRALPQARRSRGSSASRASASTTPRRCGGARCARATRSWSSAAATRPGRPRCSSPSTCRGRPARSSASTISTRGHVALPRRPHRAHARRSRSCSSTEVREAAGRQGARCGRRRGQRDRRVGGASRRAPCSSSSARSRTPSWLGDESRSTRSGYILTGPARRRKPRAARARLLLLETSRPGVFAVGDVRSGSIKRVASAVGEGSMAVRLVHEHLALQGRAPAQA